MRRGEILREGDCYRWLSPRCGEYGVLPTAHAGEKVGSRNSGQLGGGDLSHYIRRIAKKPAKKGGKRA